MCTYLRNGFTVLLLVSMLVSCGKKSSPTDNDADIQKSIKRGLAYNLTDAADLDALKEGVSWWYNWYFETTAPGGYADDYQMEFIPMLWGNNSNADYARLLSFILAHPEIQYLLVLNEPNLTDQANMTPTAAVAEWMRYEQFADDLAAQGRDISLVGPAMNWGTLAGFEDPVAWLDAFYAAYRDANNGADPRIDYLAFHWYDYGLEAQLNRLQKYGKQIWITEMANWNPVVNNYQKQAQQMREMVALCESRDDVFRYAWFIGRGGLPDANYTYLFNSDPGDLNELGLLYLSLPYSE